MEIALFISGVADPKWPVPQALSVASLQAHTAQFAALSPFDEAALELALAMRDRESDTHITALVCGPESLARRVAGWRPDTLHRIDLQAVPSWHCSAVSDALAQALQALAPAASIMLIGREFGDFDDGSVPAGLSFYANTPYISLVLSLQSAPSGWSVMHQSANGMEHVQISSRALLGATNDPGNRLRHPLMKNVMMAKSIKLPIWRATAPPSAAHVPLEGVHAVVEPPRSSACEWLEGTAEQKAASLARVLMSGVQA
ncbi:MAG: hypothetical protein EBQ86_00780 [Betaproteobacteria bacterium]|nr:hypothetical protein [Betaproteobacteria bacterium]